MSHVEQRRFPADWIVLPGGSAIPPESWQRPCGGFPERNQPCGNQRFGVVKTRHKMRWKAEEGVHPPETIKTRCLKCLPLESGERQIGWVDGKEGTYIDV